MSSSRTQTLVRMTKFNINNCNSLKRLTATAHTLCQAQFIMDSRRLTGKWYLKKKLFGFVVMVETIQTTTCEFDFSTSPEFKRWEKAKESDFIELGINVA